MPTTWYAGGCHTPRAAASIDGVSNWRRVAFSEQAPRRNGEGDDCNQYD